MTNQNLEYDAFLHLVNLSKDEFLNEFRNSDTAVKEFYLQVLTNIYMSILMSNEGHLRIQIKFIVYLKDLVHVDTLQLYFESCENPIRNANIILLAIKHNNAEFLDYLLSFCCDILSTHVKARRKMLPLAIDDECHNVFYYLLRFNNVVILKLLIEKWPHEYFDTNPCKLDELLSEAYSEMKLKNINLSDEMKSTVEESLFNLRFFHNSSEGDETGTTAAKIKERVKYVLEAVCILPNEEGDKFLYLSKFIARNIFVLKQQLGVTYYKLPWGEIEFCLVSFINMINNKQSVHLWNTTLTRSKMLIHLRKFCDRLKVESDSIANTKSAKELACRPRKKRDKIVCDILNQFPYFKELYSDYEQIRDMYSLEKIKSYKQILLSVDPEINEHRFTIIRILQVMGENFKNTLTCPNLSNSTYEVLELSLPQKSANLLPDLRDLWFHNNKLRPWNEEEIDWNTEFFTSIQKEALAINEVIDNYCFEKKQLATKILLEKILQTANSSHASELLRLLNNLRWCDIVEEYPKMNRLELLQTLIANLNTEISCKTSYEIELFNQIDEILKLLNSKFKLLKFDYALWVSLKELSYNILFLNFSHSHICELKFKARKLLDYFQNWEFENLKIVVENTRKIFENVSRRLLKTQVENLRILVIKVYQIVQMKILDLECLSLLRDKLSKSQKGKKHTGKVCQTKAGISNDTLKDILKLLSNVLNYYKTTDDKRQCAAIEMLILDILNNLDESFTNNNCFIDSPSPILMGKNLRNNLAHGNVLNDILFDTSRTTLLSAQTFISKCTFPSRNKMDKIIKNDPGMLKYRLNRDLKFLTIQNKFFKALTNGNINYIKCCIERGADLNARNEQLWTSLHFAAKGSSVEVLSFVLKHISLVDPKDINGQTPLHVASIYGNQSIVEYLIEKSALPDDVDNSGKTALHIAALYGHINIVQSLLKYNVDTKIIDNFLSTPLQYAIENGHNDVAKILLSKEKHIRGVVFTSGHTPLHLAARRGNLKFIDFLLKSNANVNAINDEWDTPLHHAVEFGHEEVVECLLSSGARVNVRNIYGKMPIYEAIQNCHEKIVSILLQSGAEINCKDILCITPLHIASHFGHRNLVQKLLDLNSTIDATDDEGMSPLHLAAANSHLDIVKLLVENKASIDLEDSNGRTPLYFIAKNGNNDLMRFLIEFGVCPNNKYKYDKTFLHFAAASGTRDIVETLIKEGALDSRDADGWSALHYCS